MIRNVGIFFVCVGITVTLLFAGIMAYYIWDEIRSYESAARISKILHEQIEINKNIALRTNETVPQADETTLPENEFDLQADKVVMQLTETMTELPQLIEINGESFIGTLRIPSLSLELPINNEWDEIKLKESPCRYTGDFTNPMVIGAHDYKRHFGKISTLKYGEEVMIIDAEGYEHLYIVESVTILYITDITITSSTYDLTLLTCTPKGNTERFIVRCTKMQSTDDEIEIAEIATVTEQESESKSEAPNYQIDYKNEIIKLQKGDLYSLDGGTNFIEVTKKSGISLDVSSYITNSNSIQIRRKNSEVQTITPVARIILDNETLLCNNGKVILDTQKYEVYNPNTKKWGSIPKVTKNKEFDIRLKATVEETNNGTIGNASSNIGKLKITYGIYDTSKNKKGIIAAEIVME